ncbi:hypothetical protein KY285_029435 [Solanum tuberosum]|nr:hypothetical protein KY285_029435 [Solanum tuberosum]
MAVEPERVMRKRKHKVDRGAHRKLGVDQKVEVKSVEDGFLGSWHLGTVVSCSDLIREVEYEFIWSERGSGKLVEVVNISPIIDGVLPVDERPVHQCGMIRPSPPPCEFGSWLYGQCVDCFYQDAWWEGVLFDREEGHEERKVFFPELGDEMKAKIDKLRISQDWDEVTEVWTPRGSWTFLQVIEEIKKLNPLLVSVKQIWYEVQLKDDFDEHLKQWTSSSKDIWRKLVKEVVHDSTKLTVKHFLSELNSSQIFGEGRQLLKFSEPAFIAELNPKVYFAPFTEAACTLDSAATLPVDQDFSDLQPVEKLFVSEESAPAAEDVQMTGILPSTESELPTFVNSKRGRGRPRKLKKIFKGRTRVGEPDSCREANSTKTIKEKIFEHVSPLQQPVDQDVPNLQQPLDQDISDLQPVEKQLVSEESAPATEDVLLSGILSNTKSQPLTIANSKACRGRPRTKRKIYEGKTVVGEPASCPDTTSTETFNKPPSDETAGILSSTTQTLENSKPRRGRPPKRMKTLGEPDSYPEATLIKELKKPTSHQIAGILSNGKCVNSKSRRGRLATKKKKFVWQSPAVEPDSRLKVITKCMPSMSSIKKFKKHLLWTGWRFELKREGGKVKKSYVAPNGTVCASISEVCQVLEESKICEVVPPVEQSSLHGDTDNSTQSPCMERPTCREVPELHKETIAETEEISIEPGRTGIQRGDTDNSTQSPCMERPTCREVPELHKETIAETEEINIEPGKTGIQRGDTDKSTLSPCMERPTCREVPELHKETIAETEEISIEPEKTGIQRGDTDNSTQSPCMEKPTCREVPELHKETIAETEEIHIEPGKTGIQRGDTDNSTQFPCMEKPTCREVPELHKETIAETEEINIEPGKTGIQRGDTDNSTLSPCMERPTCREVPELHKETIAETEEINIEPGKTGIQRGDTDNSTLSPCMERPTCREVPELHKETIAETEEISIEPANTGIQHEEKGFELEEELEETEIPQQETGIQNEEINAEPGEPRIEPEICRQAVIDYCLPKSQDISAYQKSYRNGVKIGDTALKAKNYLVANGWKLIPAGKNDKRIRYFSPEGKTFLSFREACKWCVKKWEAESHLPEQVSSQSAVVDKPLISLLRESRKKRKHADVKSRPSLKKGDGDMRSSKRARKVALSSSNQIPRTVLSWLIDKNVVLPRAKVKYCEKKNGNPMAEGRITREGIKCNCCQKIFGLRNFEAHAGSIYNRPSANIYLEDGRSLLECQMQMKHKHSIENKEGSHFTENDYICSVCHYGGDLILCDGCPSSFHPDCLGVKEVPDGDWFCPSCCCKVCGESRFDKNRKQFTDNTLLICCQCNHKYHAQCVRNNGLEKLDDFPVGNWLCNKSCKLICLGMRQLLKKSVIVGNDNLTWRLLKYTEPDDESSVEIYSRLCVALNVMHDSFEPVKERLTGRDIAEDVIFSRWSELNRLNFQGFYTVLLERNDELISVATVRVYGEKVAEIPLVATQFQHRRLGMCRILFNELEKTLAGLGVERLVLPAVPGVLNTWTTKFGFSVVKQSERANFFDYTFLDFQGTIMCQKILEKTPAKSQQTHVDNTNGKDNVAVSEVFQATQVEGCATVDQGRVGYVSSLFCSALKGLKKRLIRVL